MSNDTIITPENADLLLTDFGGLKLVSPSDMRRKGGWNLTIFGPAGTGKTTVASTIAESKMGGTTVHVDVEGGTSVLAHLPPTYRIAEMTTWAQVNKFRNDCRAASQLPFTNVILDNMTEIADMHLQSLAVGREVQLQDYKTNTATMLKFIRDWRDMARTKGINVIFIAWDDVEKSEEGAVIGRRVQFTPSLAKQYPYIVDNIGYLTVEPNPPKFTRKISFVPVRSDAKLRRAADDNSIHIPLELWNPHIGALIDTVVGGMPWDSKPFVKPGASS